MNLLDLTKLRSLRKIAKLTLDFRGTTSKRYYSSGSSGSKLLLKENMKLKAVTPSGKEVPVPAGWRMLNDDHYIDAAFRSSRTNEVFIFCLDTYCVVNYDPTSPGKDRIVKEPFLLMDGFPNIYRSPFSTVGVEAAFGCHGVDQAYLFTGSLCAKVEYGPHIHMGNMIDGSCTNHIVQTFPCLEYTSFSCLLDAAFESTLVGEAYLFKGPEYLLLNYNLKTVVSTGLITDAFPCLSNTKFATDIKAAFASHLPNQAYLFKGDNSYVVIRYTPHSDDPNDSYIISGPHEMVPSNWPSLQEFVPYKKNTRHPWIPRIWIPVWLPARLPHKHLATPPRIQI